MAKDAFGRKIEWLRISVTDRCNFRCGYCLPPQRIRPVDRRVILSFEEIEQTARAAVASGIRKLRITGGEPLVRKGITGLVELLARIEELEDLAMTTNGSRLAGLARELRRAGLRRINVSLDSTDPEEFRRITGGGELGPVLEAIRAARAAGLEPVKLNCVFENSPQDENARSVAEFAARENLQVRFIRRMDFETGFFRPVIGGRGGDCARCNRLRLSADGRIRPCLFSDQGFAVRELGPERALALALENKPESGSACSRSWMRVCGG